jgi:membrane-associated protein
VIGGIIWVVLFIYGGYFFGNNDFVKNNFSVVILGIIFISVLPIAFEALRMRMRKGI